MKASIAIVLASSVLAAANPIKTDWVTDITVVTVTVEAGSLPKTAKPGSNHGVKDYRPWSPKPSSPTTSAKSVSVSVAPTTKSSISEPPKKVTSVTPPANPTTKTTSSSSSTVVKSAVTSPTDFVSAALYHHNVHRANHSAPEVTYDDGLASSALTLAKRCVFKHDVTIGGGGYGQNIASYGSSGDISSIGATKSIARAISDMWYNGELPLYPDSNYDNADVDTSKFESWGHFSQVVWKDTEKIGCAAVICPAGTIFSMESWFSVCNYQSPGNVSPLYNKNVARPLGHPTVQGP